MTRSPVSSILLILLSLSVIRSQEIQKSTYGAFNFEFDVRLPGVPEEIYDALTGDISGWWDHTISEDPLRLQIDPRPGGGFDEIFDDEGNGVRHAVITIADPGKMLRFEGPLGLTGYAVKIVSTYELGAIDPDSTNLHLSVHYAGEMPEGIDEIMLNVWKHFLIDRFKPYVEAGRHREIHK